MCWAPLEHTRTLHVVMLKYSFYLTCEMITVYWLALIAQQAHDAVLTSLRRNGVALTSVRRQFDVMCLLGINSLSDNSTQREHRVALIKFYNSQQLRIKFFPLTVSTTYVYAHSVCATSYFRAGN